MTRYRFRALDAAGQSQSGTMDADNEAHAARQLQQRGLTPVSVEALDLEPQAVLTARGARRRVQAIDRIVLLRELATLLESGVSMSEALGSLASAYQGRPLGPAVSQVDRAVRNGASLSAAFAQSSAALSPMVMALVKAGEATGQMAASLADAADTLENDLRLRRDLRNALIYPTVLVVAGIVAVLIIFVGVVPRFASVLRNPKADLPAMSRWVIETGVWVHGHLLAAGLGVGVLAALVAAAASQAGWRQRMLDRLAGGRLFGPWLTESQVGRWAGGLGALIANRVPIAEALRLSSSMTTLASMSQSVQRCARDVEQGRAMSESLRGAAWMSPTALNLLRVGERSGSLDRMLQAVAKMNQESAANRQRQLLALIEPAAILVIAGVIAFIMIAVMMAITSMSNVVV